MATLVCNDLNSSLLPSSSLTLMLSSICNFKWPSIGRVECLELCPVKYELFVVSLRKWIAHFLTMNKLTSQENDIDQIKVSKVALWIRHTPLNSNYNDHLFFQFLFVKIQESLIPDQLKISYPAISGSLLNLEIKLFNSKVFS